VDVVGDSRSNIRINVTSPETRMIVLPDAEDRTIVFSLSWTKHQNVTDGQPDGQRDSPCYYSGLHCEQCGRAVKILPASQYLVVFRGTVNHNKTTEETECGSASVSVNQGHRFLYQSKACIPFPVSE